MLAMLKEKCFFSPHVTNQKQTSKQNFHLQQFQWLLLVPL